MPRLLQCLDCVTLDKLPDYTGHPSDDVLLEDLIRRKHIAPNGERHRGNLHVCDQETWDKLQGEEKLQAELLKQTGEYYATRDTYREDAMACYAKHGHPTQGCMDYKNEDRRIGNPTKEGWAAGSQGKGVKVYLCSFCPVQSWVTTEIRHRKKLYK